MDNIISALLSIIVTLLLWVLLFGYAARPLSETAKQRVAARTEDEKWYCVCASRLLGLLLTALTFLILWLGFRGLINSGLCS